METNVESICLVCMPADAFILIVQFLDQLHQPTAYHQDANTYLGQLDDLDYDRVEFIFDNVQVFPFISKANRRLQLGHLSLLQHCNEKLKERRTDLYQ
jgi:hypothetical protein